MTVNSAAFSQGVLPQRFTCHGGKGGKISPPLDWTGAPSGTKSYAIVVDDAAAPITPYIYWIVFDIPQATTDIQNGPQLPPGARQADNSLGQASYDPPCPDTPGHSYRFTVYALGFHAQPAQRRADPDGLDRDRPRGDRARSARGSRQPLTDSRCRGYRAPRSGTARVGPSLGDHGKRRPRGRIPVPKLPKLWQSSDTGQTGQKESDAGATSRRRVQGASDDRGSAASMAA